MGSIQHRKNGFRVLEAGTIHVAPGGPKPMPGDPVVWHDEEKQVVRLPTTTDESIDLFGILILQRGQGERTAFDDGQQVQWLVRGLICVPGGGGLELGEQICWDLETRKWKAVCTSNPSLVDHLRALPPNSTYNDFEAMLDNAIAVAREDLNASLRRLNRQMVRCVRGKDDRLLARIDLGWRMRDPSFRKRHKSIG